MSKRKFREVTRGGYWVRNIEQRETDGAYVFQAQIGNHYSESPSDDPRDWLLQTFTINGYFHNYRQSKFDLIEDTE